MAFYTLYGQDVNHHVYSIFAFNLIKYSEWPASDQADELKVMFIGSSKVYQDFVRLAQMKTVNGKSIHVVKVETIPEKPACDVLYVSKSSSDMIGDIINKTSDTPVMVITEQERLIEYGATISFLESNGKLRFQINDGVLEAKNINMSNKLKSLAYHD